MGRSLWGMKAFLKLGVITRALGDGEVSVRVGYLIHQIWSKASLSADEGSMVPRE
jgi:hypothetical protein